MKNTSGAKKASEHLAVRTSGRPLFSYTQGEEKVEVFDLEQFRRDSGIKESDVDSIIAALMMEGQAEHEEMVFELHDGQGLTRYL